MSKARTAVVTGSTSGIGLGIARALAGDGCHVVLNSFTDGPDDHALAEDIRREFGVEAVYLKADMAKTEECRALVDETVRRLGKIDILVNNAGIQYVAPVESFPTEKWDAILAINLNSAFHTIAAAVPHMKAQQTGRIVNIASAHGLRASAYKSAYVAAKHGLVGLTKTVALELADDHVTCNAICPGYVLTPLVESQIPEQMEAHGMDRETVVREVMLARQPMREFATVEQIGAAAVFLCSQNAALVTGTTLSVDGGWTAR